MQDYKNLYHVLIIYTYKHVTLSKFRILRDQIKSVKTTIFLIQWTQYNSSPQPSPHASTNTHQPSSTEGTNPKPLPTKFYRNSTTQDSTVDSVSNPRAGNSSSHPKNEGLFAADTETLPKAPASSKSAHFESSSAAINKLNVSIT